MKGSIPRNDIHISVIDILSMRFKIRFHKLLFLWSKFVKFHHYTS